MSLVVVARYLSLPEAHIAAGALRSAGLNPTVFDDASGSVMAYQQMYLGGYRLAVPETEIETAFEVLKLEHVDPSEMDETPEDEDPPMRTPRWGLGWTVLGVVLWILSFPAAYALVMVRRKPTPVRITALVVLALFSAAFWALFLLSLVDRNVHPTEIG